MGEPNAEDKLIVLLFWRKTWLASDRDTQNITALCLQQQQQKSTNMKYLGKTLLLLYTFELNISITNMQ